MGANAQICLVKPPILLENDEEKSSQVHIHVFAVKMRPLHVAK